MSTPSSLSSSSPPSLLITTTTTTTAFAGTSFVTASCFWRCSRISCTSSLTSKEEVAAAASSSSSPAAAAATSSSSSSPAAAATAAAAAGLSGGLSQKGNKRNSQEEGKFVDTRIHWGSSEEGWILGDEPAALPSSSASGSAQADSDAQQDKPPGAALRDALVELLLQASGTHYQFLGVPPTADLDEIKAAYRKLTKQYHPDTTSLPLEVAAQKFVRLKEAYNVLSSMEDRRFYDWKLAQEISNQRDGRFIHPYEPTQVQRDTGSGSSFNPRRKMYDFRDPVDTLGGRNMPLDPLAQAGLLFDFFALSVAIATIIFVAFFKNR